MKAIVVLFATAFALTGLTADPSEAYVSRAEKPPAGNCQALVSRYGAGSVWFGRYSGFLSLDDRARAIPLSNQGCFPSEAACRLWQNENMTFSRGGPYVFSSCKRGVPPGY